MEETDLRWKGITTQVYKEPCAPNRYRVVFWPARLMSPVGPDGEYPRVPNEACVIVEGDQDLQINHYYPPEDPPPDLSREDYEKKALELVRNFVSGL
jgi:hypothetical protein